MIGTAIGFLLVLLALSIPVGVGMGVLGLILNALYSPLPLTVMLGELTWSSSTGFILVAVPFYIMLGEIVVLVVGKVDGFCKKREVGCLVGEGVRGLGSVGKFVYCGF